MDDSSPPRPLRQKLREHTRGEIIKAAFALFAQHGYENVPVETICQTAGVSRATFFNYFPQKELILDHFVQTRSEKMRELVAGIGEAKLTPRDLTHIFLRFTEENAHIGGGNKPLFLQTIFRQAAQGNLLEFKRQATPAILNVLEGPHDPQLAVDTLFAIYIATMLEWLMRPGQTPEQLLDSMRSRMELALEGIA